MLTRSLLISGFAALLAGCAAPMKLSMSSDNPANPDAVEAAIQPPSNTLVADRSADTQPASDSMGGMRMNGIGNGMKDMKGMNMKQGDQSTPGMQHGAMNGRRQ